MEFEYRNISKSRIEELRMYTSLEKIYIKEFKNYNPVVLNLNVSFFVSSDEEYIIDTIGGRIPYLVGLKSTPYVFIYGNEYVIIFVDRKMNTKTQTRNFYIEKNLQIDSNSNKRELLPIIKEAIICSQFKPYLAKELMYLNDMNFKVFYDGDEV